MNKKHALTSVFVLVAAFAIASVAYAWYTSAASIAGNVISTGTFNMSAGDNPINATGLVPQNAPSAAVDADTTGYKTRFVWFKNDSDVPAMAFAYVDNMSDPGSIRDKVMVKITVAPTDSPWGDPAGTLSAAGGPYLVYSGPISGIWGQDNGKAKMSTRYDAGSSWVHTPMLAHQQGWYKVVVWLDSSAGNEYQGQSLSCDLKFWGTQEDGWVD